MSDTPDVSDARAHAARALKRALFAARSLLQTPTFAAHLSCHADSGCPYASFREALLDYTTAAEAVRATLHLPERPEA